MATKKKEATINLGITGIEITNQTINLTKDLPRVLDGYGFNMNMEYRLAPSEKLLLAAVSIALIDTKNEANPPIATLGATFFYLIDNFSDVFKSSNPKPQDIPQQLTEVINSISISTCRGILYSQFKGTFLHGIILPILDPKQIQSK